MSQPHSNCVCNACVARYIGAPYCAPHRNAAADDYAQRANAAQYVAPPWSQAPPLVHYAPVHAPVYVVNNYYMVAPSAPVYAEPQQLAFKQPVAQLDNFYESSDDYTDDDDDMLNIVPVAAPVAPVVAPDAPATIEQHDTPSAKYARARDDTRRRAMARSDVWDRSDSRGIYNHFRHFFAAVKSGDGAVPNADDNDNALQCMTALGVKHPAAFLIGGTSYNEINMLTCEKKIEINETLAERVVAAMTLPDGTFDVESHAVTLDSAMCRTAETWMRHGVPARCITVVNDDQNEAVYRHIRAEGAEMGFTPYTQRSFYTFLEDALANLQRFRAIFYDICGTWFGRQPRVRNEERNPRRDIAFLFAHCLASLEGGRTVVFAITVADRCNTQTGEGAVAEMREGVVDYVTDIARKEGIVAENVVEKNYNSGTNSQMSYFAFVLRAAQRV